LKGSHHNDDNGSFKTCVTLAELLLCARVSHAFKRYNVFVCAVRWRPFVSLQLNGMNDLQAITYFLTRTYIRQVDVNNI